MKNIDLLSKAFANLRKAGFVARQNFTCCASCAADQIRQDVLKMPVEKRAKVRGMVYYHHQDAANMRRDGKLFVRYGQIALDGWDTTPLIDAEVGEAVFKAFREVGLIPAWDGDPFRCVEVAV